MAVINTREKYMDAALGKDKADLVIRGGKLVNVYTAEVYRTDITVKDKRIISVGNADYLTDDKTQVIDATDKYIAPGFIDAHIHIGGTHLTMTRWAEVLLKNGTTSLATDCYDIGVVAGKKGVRFAIDEANAMGINVLFVVPVVAYMQHNPFGNSNTFNESDLFDMLGWSECVGVNEPPVAWFLEKNPSILKLCDETLRQGKIIVGHGAGTFGEKLMAYLNMGPNSDHECLSSGEAIEKLRLGMQILMREGSAAVDLEHVIKAITEYNMPSENFMFCTDERDPVDFYEVGHLNYTMRKAITSGLNPIKAVQIATINAAKYYRKDHEVGSITPGKLADIIILNDLAKVNIDYVISKGEVVVKKGKYIKPVINVKYPDYMKCKINLKKAIELKDLVIKTDRL
ncbi:MAG: amidohydrolase family protein, partial [Actinobacteria bacterium]|nr:amidohydrolase family protein [Actinomycetota bacterium]